MAKKRILTGLQPSGVLHIGNYFGALKPLVDLTNDENNEVFLMVADYHALTSVKDAKTLRDNVYQIVRDYLAAGVDPNKVTLFRQSDNPDHTEMGWVLNCMVTVPFLMQAHSYKDKVAKGLEANAGLFTYPMLMAGDIVLYDTDLVPVGEDQRQHIEYTREAVTKFNNTYGDVLKEPKEMIVKGVGVVPGTDGQKMSKSYKNTIPLFGSSEEIKKAVMGIVTDSTGDRPENVYSIHKVVHEATGKDIVDLDALYEENKGKYKVLKELLFADIEALVAPMREKRDGISDAQVKNVLAEGVEKAQKISGQTMDRVREVIGLKL
ncbi:MAG: tryptophan--tRNA ligase [Candidatus Nomurabacteria bacterium]|nr:tryptophan--tRNA ligase [Candidatus Nomurabacteria bacterium]USN87911.1 MAG: tryptophan--tRNA ligase [Candidatus Nomurabacteria bacterium]